MYKGSKRFTANVFFNSSWALFSPDQVKKQSKELEFRPTQFFGKQLSFDQFEQKILKNLRKWISQSFLEKNVLSNQFITNLSELNQIQQDDKHFDFDLMVKILQLYKLDEYTSEMRVIDDSC